MVVDAERASGRALTPPMAWIAMVVPSGRTGRPQHTVSGMRAGCRGFHYHGRDASAGRGSADGDVAAGAQAVHVARPALLAVGRRCLPLDVAVVPVVAVNVDRDQLA